MTACRNKARGAVVAALAGALTLGAVPMVAMATTTDAGASLQSASDAQNFGAGEVTFAVGANNQQLDLDNLEFQLDATNPITIKSVMCGDGFTKVDGNFDIRYRQVNDANNNGLYDEGEGFASGSSWTSWNTNPTTAGVYRAQVRSTNSKYSGGYVYLSVRFVNKSLQGAYVFDKAGDGVEDTTITYNGTNKQFSSNDLGIALNGSELTSAGNYTLQVLDSEGNHTVGVENAGDYTVVLTGTGAYDGSSVKVPFTVQKLNLAAADIDLGLDAAEAYTGSAILPSLTTVDDLDSANVAGDLTVISNEGGALDLGTYTYTVKVKDDATDAVKANYEGEGTFTMDVVSSVVPSTDFKYDGRQLDTWLARYSTIDLSKDDHFVFDASEVSVAGVDAEDLIFEVRNADTGEKGSLESLSTPGKWDLVVKINAAETTPAYSKGGASEKVTFDVKAGYIADATWFVTYNGETTTNGTAEYTGRNYLDDLTIQVKDAQGNVVDPSAYTLEITNTTSGEKVDSIVDHGTYEVNLKSDSYDVTGCNAYTFTVKQIDLDRVGVKVNGTFNDEDAFLVYTGSELTPGYLWYSAGADGQYGTDDDEWVELPTDVYTVSYKLDGKDAKLQESGDYVATLLISDENVNFVADEFSINVTVSAQKVYADVPNDQWYSEVVYEASRLQYMTGYEGTKFFGPADYIKRGDVAMVLYKMSGNYTLDMSDSSIDPNKAYDTDFSDVNGYAYYARAIQWAAKLGIVSGDDNADTFRPEDAVTREELAKMLYKYMELQGETEDVDADAILAEYEDEDTVSEWAREYVAWMVDQDVMGQDSPLAGADPISRAMVAAMTVRIQPDGMLHGFMR